MLVVPGEWFAELQQLPAAEQQHFIDALAELGYMQLKQTAEEAILVSPNGVKSIHNMLHKACELQAQRGSGSAAVHGDASNIDGSLQDEDEHPQQHQGSQAGQQQQRQPAGEAHGGGLASGAAAGDGSGSQEQGENSNTGNGDEQGKEEPGRSGVRAPRLPELPDGECVHLCLSSESWTGHGLPNPCTLAHSGKATGSGSLPLVAQFKSANDGVELDVLLKIEACLEREVSMLQADGSSKPPFSQHEQR